MSYLDGTGLATLWAKIKQYVRDNATSSIPDLSIITSKLAQGAVTFDKLSSDIFVIEARTLKSNYTIGAGDGWSETLSIEKAGYKPIGLVGWYIAGTNARWCIPEQIYIRPANNDVGIYVWNQHASQSAVITFAISVLYMKIS